MATIVVDDMTTITTHDAVTGTFGLGGVKSPNFSDTNVKVQGTAAARGKMTALGIGGTGFNAGTTDVSAGHVFIWVRTLDVVNTRANHGWRIRLSTATDGASNYKDITVGGSETDRVRTAGFSHFCCSPHRSGENGAGTAPSKTAVVSFSAVADHLSNSVRETWFIDEIKYGTGITVTGGTVGAPGNSVEIASDDQTNGRGTFRDINGIFYVMGTITIGDVVAAAVSHFAETLKTWVFEDMPVSNIFHHIKCVGGTGTNVVTFGSLVGSGLSAIGVGGNNFLSARANSAPFNLVCTNPSVSARFYGCQFINSLYEDHSQQAWSEDNSASSFTDLKQEANISTVVGSLFPAIEAVNDAFYIGDANRGFFGAEYVASAIPTTSAVVVYEYYNGTTWVALKSVVDGTEVAGGAFQQSGRVTWAKPGDWNSVAVNAVIAYYMRVRIVSGSFSFVNPSFTSFRPMHSGLMLLQQAGVEAISCLFSGCGPVSVLNGALLRRCTITDSNAGAAGALDLGPSDPATDTVRDLQIQNSDTGIFVKPTAAITTYNFRNIRFAGNTVDVRVEHNATTEDSYDEVNMSGAGRVGNGTIDGQAQSFTGLGGTLNRVRVKLERVGTLAGNIVVNIYAHTGTFGSSGIPTGAPLAVSELIDVATIQTGSSAIFDFQFMSASVLTLVGGTKYVMAVEYSGGDAANFIFVGRDSVSPTHPGNVSTFNGATWTATASQDLIFYVFTNALTALNLSEGSSTPTVLQVGNPPGTVIIANVVNLTVNVFDTAGNPLSGVRVAIFTNDAAFDELMNEDTIAGAATRTFRFSADQDIVIRVRESPNTTGGRFVAFSTTGTITISGFSVNVVLQDDPIATVN